MLGARAAKAAFLADYWLHVRGMVRLGCALFTTWCASRLALGVAEYVHPSAYARCCTQVFSLGSGLDDGARRGLVAAIAAQLLVSLLALLLCFPRWNPSVRLAAVVGYLARRRISKDDAARARVWEWREGDDDEEPGLDGLVFGVWCVMMFPLAFCTSFVRSEEGGVRKVDVHSFCWVLSCAGVLLQLRGKHMLVFVAIGQLVMWSMAAAVGIGCIETGGLTVSIAISLLAVVGAVQREHELSMRFQCLHDFSTQQLAFTWLVNDLIPQKLRDTLLSSSGLGEQSLCLSQRYPEVALLFVQVDVDRALSRSSDGSPASIVEDLDRIFTMMDNILEQEPCAYKVETVSGECKFHPQPARAPSRLGVCLQTLATGPCSPAPRHAAPAVVEREVPVRKAPGDFHEIDF